MEPHDVTMIVLARRSCGRLFGFNAAARVPQVQSQ